MFFKKAVKGMANCPVGDNWLATFSTLFHRSLEALYHLLEACWWFYSMGQLLATIIYSWLECF